MDTVTVANRMINDRKRPGVRIELECDGCRKIWAFDAPSLGEATAQVDAAGWLHNQARDQDICPDCFHTRVGYHIPPSLR